MGITKLVNLWALKSLTRENELLTLNLTRSLRKMQKFYGLEVTGEADSATLNLMKKKRCGAKDMEYGNAIKNNNRSGTVFICWNFSTN